MTREELALLLYLETCQVDQSGAVDPRRVNTQDMAIIRRWEDEGFVVFGRVSALDITPSRAYWVGLSDEAWAAAHAERRARAARCAERRTWETTHEKRLRDERGAKEGGAQP